MTRKEITAALSALKFRLFSMVYTCYYVPLCICAGRQYRLHGNNLKNVPLQILAPAADLQAVASGVVDVLVVDVGLADDRVSLGTVTVQGAAFVAGYDLADQIVVMGLVVPHFLVEGVEPPGVHRECEPL